MHVEVRGQLAGVHHVGSWAHTEVVRLHSKCLYQPTILPTPSSVILVEVELQDRHLNFIGV